MVIAQGKRATGVRYHSSLGGGAMHWLVVHVVLVATYLAASLPANANGDTLPVTVQVVAEFPVGSGEDSLGVEQPLEDAPVTPRSIAILPGSELVILDNVNQRLANFVQGSGSLKTFARIDPAIAAVDLAVRSNQLLVLDASRVQVVRATSGILVGTDVLFDGSRRSSAPAAYAPFVGVSNHLSNKQPNKFIVKADALRPDEMSRLGMEKTVSAGSAPLIAPGLFNMGEVSEKTARGYRLVRLLPGASLGGSIVNIPVVRINVEPLASDGGSIAVVGAWIVRESADGRVMDVHVQEIDMASSVLATQSSIRRYSVDPVRGGDARLASVATLVSADVGGIAAATDDEFAYQLRPVLDADGTVVRMQMLKSWFRAPAAPHVLSRYNGSVLDARMQAEARSRNETFCKHNPQQGDPSEVLRRMRDYANRYADLRWPLNQRTVTELDSCVTNVGGWAAARQLKEQRAGTIITGVPYGWGRHDSLDGSDDDFLKRLQSGKLASNVCAKDKTPDNTHIYAGIDCSGFVQRVLGLVEGDRTYSVPGLAVKDKLGTSGFQRHVVALSGMNAVGAGDVLLKLASKERKIPTGHIIVINGIENGGMLTIESTVSCPRNTAGVCRLRRSFSALGQYTITRPVVMCNQTRLR